MRVLIVEDEPYLAEAVRDGLRLEAIAADVAGDGDSALELLDVNSYDLAVLDRDIPGPSGDEVAGAIVASGSGIPILMLTAADRIDDKASGFELGADDYLTKPFELRELVLRLRALDRRRAYARPPVREMAGLRLDPFRREVFRDGRYVALTRKQLAVLEVLVAAEGGVLSTEELLAQGQPGRAGAPFRTRAQSWAAIAASLRACARVVRAISSSSAVRSRPPSTIWRPLTNSAVTGAGAPRTSAATGSAMEACSRVSIRHSTRSASLPGSSEPISAARPRTRAPPWVPRRSA
ncbi:Regulator of RpoS [Streptomyces hirsutus]